MSHSAVVSLTFAEAATEVTSQGVSSASLLVPRRLNPLPNSVHEVVSSSPVLGVESRSQILVAHSRVPEVPLLSPSANYTLLMITKTMHCLLFLTKNDVNDHPETDSYNL